MASARASKKYGQINHYVNTRIQLFGVVTKNCMPVLTNALRTGPLLTHQGLFEAHIQN